MRQIPSINLLKNDRDWRYLMSTIFCWSCIFKQQLYKLWVNQLSCGSSTSLQLLLISFLFPSGANVSWFQFFLLLNVLIALCPEAGREKSSWFSVQKIFLKFQWKLLKITNPEQWLVMFLHTVCCCERHFEGPGKQKRPDCCNMCRWVNKESCFVKHLDILKEHEDSFLS